MGRSSNSSHYQLSANRLISRIHIKARYIAATTPLEPNKVEIVCCGWNGFKLHCQGRTWDLSKGDSFTSETECAEIMLDVQDARVRVAWPESSRKDSVGTDALWDDDSNSSLGRASASNSRGQLIESSPMRRHSRLESPVSPTPVRTSGQTLLNLDLVQESSPEPLSASLPGPSVHIYEDESADVDDNIAAGNSMISTVAATSFQVPSSPPSDLSDPEDAHDPDEENDPVVHSFGPFGADISSRMASFTAVGSPEAPRNRSFRDLSKLSPLAGASSKPTNEVEALPIVNHVANQLAFSRLSSTPLSVIMDNLPTDLKGALTKAGLRQMLHGAVCIGEIPREGKDAAGKALESEYYYKPDEDTDAGRRAAVVDGLRKPSLRNCRKQHKVRLTDHSRAIFLTFVAAILLEEAKDSIKIGYL